MFANESEDESISEAAAKGSGSRGRLVVIRSSAKMAANLQSMVQYWKNFDLPQLQRELDVVATELANRQDESDTSRKKLVELSREFKKSTPEDIRQVVAPLLKNFQLEIDNLSKRSKAAEAAFLNVYKKIIDVADPMPVLEYSEMMQQKMLRIQDLEIENKQLRETLNDYNEEFKEVKNQDVTIKQLRERLKDLEEKLDSAALVRSKEKERELQKQFSDKQRHLQESQMTVIKKLEDAEHKVNSLQSALDSSQSELFDIKSKYDEDSHAKSDEMEIIMTDMERANQRALLAEKEVGQLKDQLAAANRALQLADQIQKAPDMEQAISILTRSSLEMELAAKEKEISQLVSDIQQLQSTINSMKETSASQIAQLEEQLEEKNKRIQKLEEKLDVQEDYDEIKRELGILKSVEFSSASSTLESNKPLEMLLLQKNKALQSENTVLKVNNADAQGPSQTSMPGSGPGPDTPFPPPLQTVETFGSLLGEEIVATWQHRIDTVCSPSEEAANRSTPNAASSSSPSTPVNDAKIQSVAMNLPNGLSTSVDSPTNTLVLVKEELNESRIKSAPVETRALEKLQELLRQNIEKHANDTLNTMNISRRVRELLSIHNIGQRLFAKYILGLSQGTVSELLSKPKPWDKLTEKGRDSYRKMHAWACDDGCVMVLKSLVPRKGKHCAVDCRESDGSGGGGVPGGVGSGGGNGVGGGGGNCARYYPPMACLSPEGMTQDSCTDRRRWEFSGKDPAGGLPGFRAEDVATEERITLILNEAQLAMKSGPMSSGGGTTHGHQQSIPPPHSHSLHHHHHQHHHQQQQHQQHHQHPDDRRSVSPSSKMDSSPLSLSKEHYGLLMASSAGSRRVRKYENDDIPQEMVTKIYQEELAKLMGRSLEEGAMLPYSKDQYQRTQDEIRLALNVYHQELSRLTAQQIQVENGVQDLSMPKGDKQRNRLQQQQMDCRDGSNNAKLVNDGSQEGLGVGDREGSRTPRDRGGSESPLLSKADNLRHAGSAFTLVRPKTEPADDVTSPTCTVASPLQRMQSITNSLISQPSLPSMPSLPQRPLRAVLPPITQHQFDQYTNLNTEDIVKKVKEQLSQFSISQRLFGESVLGLSQGSVSDLLARPKPWHMLTQKGREPFIRMKIFLEDENAVHKLVASQYKIAPEKLMRTGGGYGMSPPAGSSKHHSMKDGDGSKHGVGGSFVTSNNSHHHHHGNHHHHHHPHQHHSSHSGVTVNQVHLPSGMVSTSPQELTRPSSHSDASAKKGAAAAAAAAAAAYRSIAHLQPSVYEMAALTQDLDTQIITTKIKETLLANNIGQKIFGEVVLGLSQGSVSELLSKPKPWHMLSIKGREPFIRMQLWLSDPHNVDRLQVIKNERREANKRRRSTVDYLEGMEALENNNHIHHGNGNLMAPSPIGPAPKKPRVLFSEEQKEALRIAFALDPYPSTSTIEFLAQELNLTSRTITNWFHNHRMRLKQQVPHNMGLSPRGSGSGGEEGMSSMAAAAVAAANGRESSTFDPGQFRALLSQRLIEIQKEKSGMLGGGCAPLGQLPYSYYSNSSSPLSGLDLSVSSSCHSAALLHLKREPPDMEVDSNLSSDYNDEDSNSSTGTTKDPCDLVVRLTESGARRVVSEGDNSVIVGSDLGGSRILSERRIVTSSSSRRKPAAPQWVNPGWDTEMHMVADEMMDDDEDDEGDDDLVGKSDDDMLDGDAECEDYAVASGGGGRVKTDNVIINGVCVRQTKDFDLPSPHEEETVRVEPAPVPDSETDLATPNAGATSSPRRSVASSAPFHSPRDSPASHDSLRVTTEGLRESCAGEPLGSPGAVSSLSSSSEDCKERMANIERLEKSLHEQEECWEEDNEERQNNIEKLQQRIKQEEETEDWEF